MASSLAVGQVALLRGRPAVADFEIKPNAAPAVSAMRIIPSTTMLKRNPGKGPTGTLKGTARDQSGKALARALVSLKGLAMARTDSQGRYVFLNVPAGEHLVTVQKSGLRPMSTRVLVRAQRFRRGTKSAHCGSSKRRPWRATTCGSWQHILLTSSRWRKSHCHFTRQSAGERSNGDTRRRAERSGD